MLKPAESLTEADVKKGLRLIIFDGLATETMNALVGGVFLVAMALLLGASNFQIGLLAALPTVTNFFQLASIWLVRRFNNRRAVCVIGSFLARIPLILIGAAVFFFKGNISIVIVFLFFYYMFGSIAGLSWNAWMKDLVPERMLGSYFARRTSFMQVTNVSLSFILALIIDYVKLHMPQNEITVYAVMFAVAGIVGLIGVLFLSKTPEPQSHFSDENIFKLLKRPLKDANFRRLLVFNSFWIFAINISTPFFSVFMMKAMGLPLFYIIGLTILSQVSGIITIRMWGKFADRYSNKTIIAIAAPLYILCLAMWCFVGIYTSWWANIALLIFIHMLSGTTLAGINLCLTNIGLKLAPTDLSIIYLSVKNIVTSVFSSMAPLLGGILADFFSTRNVVLNITYRGPEMEKIIHLLELKDWNFLFVISALIAIIAIELLMGVKEIGEVDKDSVRRIMRSSIKSNLREYFLIGYLIDWHEHLITIIRKQKESVKKLF